MARADGIEFILALFVDLTGKPCAKLVPIEAVEELQDRRRRASPGTRRARMGQEPKDPDLVAVPDADVVHADPVRQARTGDRALRPARRGQALAVRPAGDPAGAAGEGRRTRPRAQGRRRGRVLPRRPRRRRRARHRRRRSDTAVQPLLRRPRRHPHVRPPHRGVHGDERARAGATTPTTTRTATGSSSRTSTTPTP